MTENSREPKPVGRPPKLDEHGRPTRDRLLEAAVASCVEHGYEGATLADIARRADVSTPAVYSHFPGKAALLVEAIKRELHTISQGRLVQVASLRELVRRWVEPEQVESRILVSEIHGAAIRHPEVAELLTDWRNAVSVRLQRAGLTLPQVRLFYVLLIGAAHVDEVVVPPVTRAETEQEFDALLMGWLASDDTPA